MVKFNDILSDLKAQAEALVLFANDIDGLLTCALRPSNVFGPGDTEIIPFVVNQAKSGWAKVCNLLSSPFIGRFLSALSWKLYSVVEYKGLHFESLVKHKYQNIPVPISSFDFMFGPLHLCIQNFFLVGDV